MRIGVAIALVWTTRLWITCVPLGFVYKTVVEMLPAVYVLPIWKSALMMFWGIVVVLPLGLLCALVVGRFFFGLSHQSVVR